MLEIFGQLFLWASRPKKNILATKCAPSYACAVVGYKEETKLLSMSIVNDVSVIYLFSKNEISADVYL